MKQLSQKPSSHKKKQLKRISPKVLKAIYIEAGQYALDLSKLIFGGIILTMVINADINKIVTFAIGCISIIGLTTIGFILYKKGKE